MPFLDEDPGQPGTAPAGLAPRSQIMGLAPQAEAPLEISVPTPPVGALFRAAVDRETSFGSLATRLARGPMSPPDPTFDPWSDIKGYEDYAASFRDANSADDVARIKHSIDGERKRADLLEAGGALGMVAELGAGLLDPVNLLPIGGEMVTVGRLGARLLSGAARVGAAGAIGTAAQEAVLQSTQDTRSLRESAVNVAGGAVIGGLLGGAVAGVAGRDLGRDLNRLGVQVLGDTELYAHELAGNLEPNGSLSAAYTRDTTKAQESFASTFGSAEAIRATSPLLRTGTSEALETRRLAQDLADQPLILKKNEEGIATPVSTESLIRQWQWPLARSVNEVDDLFVQYRMGRAARVGDVARIGVADMLGRGEGKLARADFMEEVGRAMRRGDQHEIPEIAQAAQTMRRQLFDPLKQRAIDAGLLPEGVDPGTAASYLTRSYNREKIAAQRPEFEGRITDWLAGEQAKKQQVATQIAPLLEEMARHEDVLGRAGRKVDRLTTGVEELEARGDELTRLSKLSYQRAETVRKRKEGAELKGRDALLEAARDDAGRARERLLADDTPANRAAFHEASQQLEILEGTAEAAAPAAAVERARGAGAEGAVTETAVRGRANRLSDKASGMQHQADAVEQAIARREARIEEIRAQLEELVGQWEGKTSKGAKAALARRGVQDAERRAKTAAEGKSEAELGRLGSADREVVRAAEAMTNANLRLERVELGDVSRQIVDRILGSPVGRLPYDVQTPTPRGFSAERPDDVRGPLKSRAFMIPDTMIEDWLESDIGQISRAYVRTMAPDVELATRFGRVDMVEQFKAVQEEYARLRAQLEPGDEKGAKKLDAAMRRDLRDLAAVRDRLRGTYGLPDDPGSLANRSFRVIRDLNYLRLLGGMTVSALPDVGRAVMQHGFTRVFGTGFDALVGNLKTFNLARGEVKMAGEALDMVLDSRAMALADILDDYGRHSKFERGLSGLTQQFGIVSLMAPWNAALKQFVGVVSQTRSLEAIEKLGAGTISRAERTRLAQFGIDDVMGARISKEMAAHGEASESGRLRWANTEAWTDDEARRVYRAALANEVNQVIVTPGQEKPLWMSTNAGKIIGQFKSFNLSSMQRVTLSGLQRRDMATMNGLALMVGLGAVVYGLKTDHDKLSADPAVWVKEGLDRSGVTGWLFDVNNIVEKFTGGAVGASRLVNGPLASRYASRGVISAVLGPSTGLVEDVGQILASATRGATGAPGQWKEADTHAVRRMIPLQNLIGWKYLFDAAERGTNSALGVPMKAH